MSLADFISMGGYGVYVWSAYGISLVALLLNIVFPIIKHRRVMLSHQNRLYNIDDEKL